MKFGRLTVIEFHERKGKNYYWKCQCECGNTRIVQPSRLINGTTVSCGCYNREVITKHGLDGNKIYHVFNSMKSRCYSQKNKSYPVYGGRGIKICEEWLNDVTVFHKWAIENGYKEGLTIDRIDVNGDYEPNNCRWITHKEQSYNLRSNKYITYNGRTQTICQWADELNIQRATLCHRIYVAKWSIEKALTTPVKSRKVKCNDYPERE